MQTPGWLPATWGVRHACPDPVEVILYVPAESSFTAIAIEQLRLALSRLYGDRVQLNIQNLSLLGAVRSAAASAGPPLAPRTRIVGHITSPALLLELLADCEQA
jgi:hypothetical protein